jgi:tRNA-uridine 2-sulfurtransferase
MKKQIKVLVAMSGGVDSSIAALLMKRKGYDIIGVFMKCWSNTKNQVGECQWREERRHALKIAAKLDIPLITLDVEKEYKKFVVEEMYKDYKKGITPNPDVLCNEKIKFPFLLKKAKQLKADFVVTGHYVQTKNTKKGIELLRGKDESKDQSYFLYRLKQSELKKLIFPIGEYTKTKIREMAEERNFQNHDKKGTVGICFIGKINLKDFLKQKVKPKKGKILNPKGEIIGQHDGIFYYTIGQRIGPRFDLDINKKNQEQTNQLSRWYVASKNTKKNELTIAPQNHDLLYRKQIKIKNLYLISETKQELEKAKNVLARIRHVGELLPSKLSFNKKSKQFQITLNVKDKRGITGVSEGQAIVLYKGRKVLGGGTISF